ncbi:hypothetical protein AMAG_19082 [Allomyces macrogynus ATCC 38327]|uniref:Sel1 repeat family protein n=1 Tax=Allomyces macrogynus (strain ATCC 38327) TaxID=578462 RepID=A0A0L0SN95_ALLM3|nr:hypothetical protein AMAG_19082 [Allomyces macrogynus ATCC 38327]|eukprot:KNE63870.1 hypothetical protein AMAG_19082 [Allomyces macrogynus ATCC 38327]
MLSAGAGVPRQLDEAFAWFLSAAKQNEVGAMVLVGNAYQHGRGVCENTAEAVWWYMRAAKLRDPIACLILASCAESGYGVPRNLKCALMWMNVAIQAGAMAFDAIVFERAIDLALRLAMSKQGDHLRALVKAGVAGPFPAAG